MILEENNNDVAEPQLLTLNT